jgi:hypothetical protein
MLAGERSERGNKTGGGRRVVSGRDAQSDRLGWMLMVMILMTG